MAKFIIQPHGRLQEWIAHEKGYFRDEGLDYDSLPGTSAHATKTVDAAGKVQDVISGAFKSYREGGGNKGVKSDISCACHWTVNQAAAEHIGTMWGKSYVVTPGGIMVPPDSPITRPEDLAGKEVAVGYRSGSHYTTIQALEAFLPPDDIKLRVRRLAMGARRCRRRPRRAGDQRLGPHLSGAGSARLPQDRRLLLHDHLHVPGGTVAATTWRNT